MTQITLTEQRRRRRDRLWQRVDAAIWIVCMVGAIWLAWNVGYSTGVEDALHGPTK